MLFAGKGCVLLRLTAKDVMVGLVGPQQQRGDQVWPPSQGGHVWAVVADHPGIICCGSSH